MYRGYLYRSGVKDPEPTHAINDLHHLIHSILATATQIYTMFPDVTEIRVVDDLNRHWFTYRYRLDQENTDELR